MRRRVPPPLVSADLAGLPVQQIAIGPVDESMAVHVSGRLDGKRLPLVCLSGYHRNMTDFADMAPLFRARMADDWPLVLIDLKGRGRSAWRRRPTEYLSSNDAHDLYQVITALGIEKAVWLGQGFGGQVLMSLAGLYPRLLAGAILIDAGPLSDQRGIVRQRINLAAVSSLRGGAARQRVFRQILGADYPGLAPEQLDRLADRTHRMDGRGRTQPLFDKALIRQLDGIDYDDVLVAHWPLFDALSHAPLLLFRTQLTDQLRRETFDEMRRRRPEATALIILEQGSPALLDHSDEVGAIVDFTRKVGIGKEPEPMVENPGSGSLMLAD